MSDVNKNEEVQYSDGLIQGSVESLDEVQQAIKQEQERGRERELEFEREMDGMMEEAQLQAWEAEEIRLAHTYHIPITDRYSVGNLMRDYDEEDKYKEYLVHGAILTCSRATADVFVLPDKKEIILDHSMDVAARCRMALNVEGRHANINGLPYATVRDTVINENIFPFKCNCTLADISREEAEAIANDPECRRFGVCQHLIRLNEKWDNMPRETGYMKFGDQTVDTGDTADITGNEVLAAEGEEGITMTSILFCKRGGLISLLKSGQGSLTARISCKALRALMELEVVGPYANSMGYLVIEDGVLIGIRPHLVGDSYVTVGFGDALQSDEDLAFYTDRLDGESAELLSRNVNDYERMKDVVIPVEICFEKLILDTNAMAEKVINDFSGEGYELSQNQLDAVVIAKYQMGTLEYELCCAIRDGAAREELYYAFMRKHGGQSFASRTAVEMNIFFDGNYYVADGSHDVIVEPFEEYKKQWESYSTGNPAVGNVRGGTVG